jgi:hypothetical protein
MVTAQQVQAQAAPRPGWWRRLSPASFVLAGLTALILWAAVAALPGQGRLGTVLGAGRAAVLMPARPITPVLITIYVCVGTLQHANLRWTFGPLGRVLVSPAYHRLHHAPDIQNANLGVALTIWDVLAGCATFPSRRAAVGRTGLDGRPVPVEQDTSRTPALLLLAGQLIEPFQARG